MADATEWVTLKLREPQWADACDGIMEAATLIEAGREYDIDAVKLFRALANALVDPTGISVAEAIARGKMDLRGLHDELCKPGVPCDCSEFYRILRAAGEGPKG